MCAKKSSVIYVLVFTEYIYVAKCEMVYCKGGKNYIVHSAKCLKVVWYQNYALSNCIEIVHCKKGNK
jgi:hypothetical protein